MPLFYWKCECGVEVRKLQDEPKAPPCECGKTMARRAKAPTTNVVETLDNGWMSKRVVRPADAERLYKERAENDPRLKKDDKV